MGPPVGVGMSAGIHVTRRGVTRPPYRPGYFLLPHAREPASAAPVCTSFARTLLRAWGDPAGRARGAAIRGLPTGIRGSRSGGAAGNGAGGDWHSTCGSAKGSVQGWRARALRMSARSIAATGRGTHNRQAALPREAPIDPPGIGVPAGTGVGASFHAPFTRVETGRSQAKASNGAHREPVTVIGPDQEDQTCQRTIHAA